MNPILNVAAAFLISAPSVLADTALLVALPAEQSALSREVRMVGQSVELAQHRVSIGYHKGEKLYIVRTGAGNLNSAMVTQALLTRYKIDRVISIGVAGNLHEGGGMKDEGGGPKTENWNIGDVFIATNVVNHQEGKETPAGFEPMAAVEKLASTQSRCEALQSNAVEIAREILERPQAGTRSAGSGQAPAPPGNDGKRDARPTNIRQGRLVSGDSFIASTAKRTWLRETFHADAVDMVSAGIVRVCEANGVPYVIIRVLSDNADESASTAFTKFVQSGKGNEPVTVPIALRLIDQIAAPHP